MADESKVSEYSTSSSLLIRARLQDADAWRKLVELYCPLVYYWCRISRLLPQDSADVAQEVFLGIYKGLSTFEPQQPGGFRAWLHGVARHKINDRFRQIAAQPPVIGGSTDAFPLEQHSVAVSSETSILDESPRLLLLDEALQQLRGEIQDQSWQVFERVVLQEQSPQKVAQSLGMKIGAVYQARSRLLKRLRQILVRLNSTQENS